MTMKLHTKHYLSTILLGAALVLFPSAGAAQGRPGGDRGRPGDDRNRHDDKPDFHFRQEDRGRFGSHYKGDIGKVRKHADRRHHINAGDHLPPDFRSHLKAVPASYYRDMPPPPPGYRFGYYDGYVVAYNPTTQIVADVLDLVDAAVNH